MKDFILMNCPSMDEMANSLSQNPLCKDNCTRVNIKWDHFPDGFPNLFIHDAFSIRKKKIVILLSLYEKENIFEQISMIYALPRHSIQSMLIVLAYFPTGTMERIDHAGQIATAKTLSRMLSATPSTPKGPPQVLVYDIHALQERFYFADSILPILDSAIPLLLHKLETEFKDEPISLAFPDEGAFKRFSKLVPESYPTITCMKIRKGTERTVSIMEGESKDRHVIIIDDLVQSGGTLMNCKNLLLSLGATKVSCFVTHAVFPGSSWKKFVEEPEEKKFYKFFVTDSCPEKTKQFEGQSPFHILSLAPSIAKYISEYI